MLSETKSRKAGKRLILMMMVISLFSLPKVYSFQFGLGTKRFVKKVVEKGQAEGKIAKTEEEKKQHDEDGGGGGESNNVPIISSMTANPISVSTGSVSTITCTASDPDNDTLTYTWTKTGGIISGTGSSVSWTAPESGNTYTITCNVSDGKGGSAQKSVSIEVTEALKISNIQLTQFQKWGVKGERSAKVSWQTNKSATSKVQWRNQKEWVDQGPDDWRWEEDQQLVKNHQMEVYWIRPGTTTAFRVISKTSSEETQSEEFSIIPSMINPGEIGVFTIFVSYNSTNEQVDLRWRSIEDDSGDSYYFVSTDGVNWGGQNPAGCGYNSILQCYITSNSNAENAPKGSRLYYKISGQSIVFYVDFPTDFYGSLYPLKP